MSEPAIQKALQAEQVFLQSEKERYLYEMREKAIRDHESAMFAAQKKGDTRAKPKANSKAKKKQPAIYCAWELPRKSSPRQQGCHCERLQPCKINNHNDRLTSWLRQTLPPHLIDRCPYLLEILPPAS